MGFKRDQFEVAYTLREIGLIVELIDPEPKKSIAYRRAAHLIESLENFEELCTKDALKELSGIGPGISTMVNTLIKKGYLPYYNYLRNQLPESLLQLAHIPGLSTKRLRALYEKKGVATLPELERELEKEEIHTLPGFTPYYVNKMKRQITEFKATGYSLLYVQAFFIAKAFLQKLSSEKVEITGDLRRKCELITHIDLLSASEYARPIKKLFTSHSFIERVVLDAKNQVTVVLKQGIRATLTIVSKELFPYALLLTTGSERHLNALGAYAEQKQIALESLTKVKSEKQLYQKLELPYIVPELREGYGEIEAAAEGTLPQLIEEKEIKGAFHCHTVDSDGINTLEEMAQAAKELGWHYLGIADHSKSSYQAHGMDEERLFLQIEKIRTQKFPVRIFAGLECDILKDGTLDFPNEILKMLDYVIISIHRHFKLDEEEMTRRLLKAIENPYTTMVGHLTGRLLRHREGYKVHVDKIIDACIANGKVIELNATPNRLDMDWRYWIKAKKKGLKCSINPDAHSTQELRNVDYGVAIARKGWLEKEDVINTYSLKEILKFLNC